MHVVGLRQTGDVVHPPVQGFQFAHVLLTVASRPDFSCRTIFAARRFSMGYAGIKVSIKWST
jgi:hypothetical protein